jgi:transposase
MGGLKYCRLSPRRRGELVKLFVAGATARAAAELVGVHRNSAALFFTKLRRLIAARQERALAEAFGGPVEIDESYFGGRRKGKRGRGAAGKVPVFGVLKRGGRVFAQVIADCKRATLLPIIRRKVQPDSVVYSDTFAVYDSLHVEGYRHVRVDHGKELAGSGGRHINGIENFWSQAKRQLRRFNGVPKESFPLFLQECVWRFNTGSAQNQLKSLRNMLRRAKTTN